MNLNDYESHGLQAYQELAKIVESLLDRTIKSEGRYRLQQIQCRAKSVESLRRRLEEEDAVNSDDIESLRKDLAGCRLVFYTNNDVNRFVQSGILSEMFDIDLERSKIHHPAPGEDDTASLFQSFNYVAKLKAERASLLEYKHLNGLWCEIQVQTSLNHAWAEMAHDTIYKRPELEGFGEREIASIERRLREAMHNHLLPAGYLFQKIANDVDRLLEGKALFDEGAIDAIVDAPNNNERRDAVKRLRDDVLPYFDDVAAEYPDIQDKLKCAWIAANRTAETPLETPFGTYAGVSSSKVTDVIADVLDEYRYLDPAATFGVIKELYLKTQDEKSKERLMTSAERLSSHTIQIWRDYGPAVQVELVKLLKAEQDIGAIAPIATKVLGEILDPDVTGMTAGSESVVFRSGSITYSKDLADARQSAVELLLGLVSALEDHRAKRDAVSALFKATGAPRQAGKDDYEVMAMILADSAGIADAVGRLASDQPLEWRQYLESRFLNVWRRYRTLPPDLSSNADVADAHERFMTNAKGCRDTLNADKEFETFKILVGSRSVFPHMWDDDGRDFRKDDIYRNDQQDALVGSIVPENWEDWKSRIVYAANRKAIDGLDFSAFENFLNRLSARNSDLVIELLEDRPSLPRWTVRPLVKALWSVGRHEDVAAILKSWVGAGEYLPEIAAAHVAIRPIKLELIEELTRKSIETGDEQSCTMLTQAAATRFSEDQSLWRDAVFFPCLAFLADRDNYGWVGRIWPSTESDSLFASLDEEQSRTLLAAMVALPSLDHNAELILAPIAQRFHALLLEWFGDRIRLAGGRSTMNFTAIPFEFYEIGERLRPHAKTVLSVLRQWNDDDNTQGSWHASHLLSLIHPQLDAPLPEVLDAMIEGADTETLLFVATMLAGFNGKEDLMPVLRKILTSDASTEEVENVVSSLIHETETMVGHFGPGETYQRKAEILKPWLDDGAPRVVSFANRQIRYFERLAARENLRAEQEIALRKLQYGEDINSDDAGGD